MLTDIEIAKSVKLRPINEVAAELGIHEDQVENYGRYIAKITTDKIDTNKFKNHHLILVTAISPTKAGNGKTTVSVGLALGMQKIGKKAVVALREPSLGPCFGMKGGAAGGGYAQVLPMDKINLHFTGDFHAITEANNMIAALLDNYRFQHEAEGFKLKKILWRRVMDVNDRGLRRIITGIVIRTVLRQRLDSISLQLQRSWLSCVSQQVLTTSVVASTIFFWVLPRMTSHSPSRIWV